MKQNISPGVAAVIIGVFVAIVGLVGWLWYSRGNAPQSASSIQAPSMLPPQFRSMSTKDPVPPAAQQAQSQTPPQGVGQIAPPGLGGSGPAIQTGGMTLPGVPPRGMPPSPPGMAPGGAPMPQGGPR